MSNPEKWRLWTIMRRRGLTITDLAQMIDYSREHLQRVKSGERPLSKALAIIIADKLKTPAEYLFGQED